MDIFSGLEKLGLSNLDIEDIYAAPHKAEDTGSVEEEHEYIVNEEDILYEKTYTCPCCDKKFVSKTMKLGKVRIIGTDEDLRPKYTGAEPLKYEIVACNRCGYAVAARDFSMLASAQKKLLTEKIGSKYTGLKYTGETYTYEEALARYKLALLCGVVKMAKASEKAYVCLKAGWLVRSYVEDLKKGAHSESTNLEDIALDGKINQLEVIEDDFLRKAYEGYLHALEQEAFPISGMDEYTVKYLLAALAKRFKEYDMCSKLLSDLLVSRVCPTRIKNKARDLKDEALKEMKKNQ